MEWCSGREKMTIDATPKVPSGDGPYVRAKHAQLVEKDLEGAIVWFWKAINEGDRVGSALKDMAVVMKQLDRCEEAIEAIKSFRVLCPTQSQDSFDNVLLDLYKGSLGWAYMLKHDYITAEVVYRKAQMIDADCNKACNLVQCLIKQSRYDEARFFLEEMWKGSYPGSDEPKTITRIEELLSELELMRQQPTYSLQSLPELDDDFFSGLDGVMSELGPLRSRRLPVFEEITPVRDQLAC
ncbi:unnamed protein product [Cuscuta epithymum]|uniref:Uncharacterized protein n=1 Tax=Cuscuta epithymum TaxID=186058 RepID=A0AAV0C0D0_9ASTE|nr:unnamed protein product [Cuscuta epithymum]